MRHNLVKTCNGRTQDLAWYSGSAPPKNCDNRFLLKPMKITLKIEILMNLGKLSFWVDLPKFGKFGKF